MINPPSTATLNYAFECDTPEILKGILSMEMKDISAVSGFSFEEMTSDISAILDLREVASIFDPEQFNIVEIFAPTFYGVGIDLAAQTEYAPDGSVESVGGFSNPFHAYALSVETEDQQIFRSYVCYNEFDLGEISSILTSSITVH